jgi:hypothetical protein
MDYEQERLKKCYEAGHTEGTYKRVCPVCGEVFYTRQPAKTYCSAGMIYFIDGEKYLDKGCKAIAAQQRRKENRNKAKSDCVCLQCGAHFTAYRADAGYCSSACRQKAYRRRALHINSNHSAEGVN